MATKKTDKPTTHVNLDALAREYVPDEAEPFAFSFGGKRFTCENPYSADFAATVGVDEQDLVGQLKLMLGEDQYAAFMEKKPTTGHVLALVNKAREYYEQHYGNPGESGGSPKS